MTGIVYRYTVYISEATGTRVRDYYRDIIVHDVTKWQAITGNTRVGY